MSDIGEGGIPFGTAPGIFKVIDCELTVLLATSYGINGLVFEYETSDRSQQALVVLCDRLVSSNSSSGAHLRLEYSVENLLAFLAAETPRENLVAVKWHTQLQLSTVTGLRCLLPDGRWEPVHPENVTDVRRDSAEKIEADFGNGEPTYFHSKWGLSRKFVWNLQGQVSFNDGMDILCDNAAGL